MMQRKIHAIKLLQTLEMHCINLIHLHVLHVLKYNMFKKSNFSLMIINFTTIYGNYHGELISLNVTSILCIKELFQQVLHVSDKFKPVVKEIFCL